MFRIRNIILLVTAGFVLLSNSTFSRAEQNVLAIFNLTPTNMEAMGYDGEILYALLSVLEREKTIELMPRREMEEMLYHAGLVQGGDTESIARAGKVLGINFVLFGNVTKRVTRIEAELKLMDVQNKRMIKTWSKSFAGREAILNEIPEFAKELSRTIVKRERSVAAPAAAQALPAVAIENLKVKGEGNAVILSWKFDPSQPIVAFNIYRSEHMDGPYQYHGKSDRNRFEDTQINKGKSYYYRVGILLSSGQEVKSDLTTQIKSVGEKIPHPPLILGANGYVRRAEIKFVPSLLNEQEAFKIKEYKVYRKKGSDGQWANISSINAKIESQFELALVVEDTEGLEDGATYVYAISSLDQENRESPQSDLVTVKTLDHPVLTVEKDGLLRKINFTWTSVENVEGYYLYRRQDQEEWQKIAKIRGASEDRHTDDKSLADGQTYQYYLSSYDAKGESGPSNTVTAKTKDRPPYPKDILAQSGLVKSVKLFWTAIDDPDVGGYGVYRGTQTDALKRISKVEGYQSHSYLDKGSGFESLEDGQIYYYAIVSFNLFGADGEPSNAVQATTKPRPKPVKGLTATKGSDNILIKWDKNPEADIKAYILARSRNGGFWNTLEKLTPDQTSFSDVDLKPQTDYRYKIIVEDQDNLQSDPVESDAIASPIAKP